MRIGRWSSFAARLLHLNVGLATFGLSIALMLRAGVGLGPWDVFHEGVALRSPLTIGQVMIGAGVALLAFTVLAAKVRPGLGTLFNMVVVGAWVDVFMGWHAFPAARGWVDGAALFAAGLLLNGLATGLYLTAGLGAGPRDGFALALARLLGITVRRARTLVELVVFASGWALGGTVGPGTVVFALAIGPLMQANLRLCDGLERWHARRSAVSCIRTKEASSPPVSSD